jgi:hypothetical protein
MCPPGGEARCSADSTLPAERDRTGAGAHGSHLDRSVVRVANGRGHIALAERSRANVVQEAVIGFAYQGVQ